MPDALSGAGSIERGDASDDRFRDDSARVDQEQGAIHLHRDRGQILAVFPVPELHQPSAGTKEIGQRLSRVERTD